MCRWRHKIRKIAVEILQSVNNRTQCLRESAYYAWLLLTYIVINTILSRLTPDILPVCTVLRGTMLLFLVTGRMPRSGKLPVLFLLTGQKSGFSPRRGDSLHRFGSNFAGPTGTWVRLAAHNVTSIGAEGWECGPQNVKNFHFLVKSRPAGATPLTDFRNF